MAKPVRARLVEEARVPEEVSFVLPSARPELYLRWMEHLREADQAMDRAPSLEAVEAWSVPDLRERFGEALRTALVPRLTEQAEAAREFGLPLVTPLLGGDPQSVAALMWYAAEVVDWLVSTLPSGQPVHRALGLAPVEPEVVDLARRSLVQVVLQLWPGHRDR